MRDVCTTSNIVRVRGKFTQANRIELRFRAAKNKFIYCKKKGNKHEVKKTNFQCLMTRHIYCMCI